MKAVWWVMRRELHVMLRAPILYVVGGLFLVVQGVAFAGLVDALSDTKRPGLLGELLEGQLAGTLLTWVLELVVLTLLGMRAIVEDKRSGAWELLLTAQVGEGAAVVGKWLAATIVYALLWLPTLVYFAVAGGAAWDGATVACGYAGAIAIGAALLAWAIAASAAMSSTLGAGALGFALLIGLFLVGELPALWPGAATRTLDAVSLRATALAFARGELAWSRVVFVAGLTTVGLSLAITLACAGRRRRDEVLQRALGTVALAAIGALACVLLVRHPVRWDVTADARNTLDPQTVEEIRSLPGPASITIVQPRLGGLEPIYDEIARVAERMAEASRELAIRRADPATAPGGLAATARAAGVTEDALLASGAVVIEVANRRRVLDLTQLASISPEPEGPPHIERLAVEQALAGALAALSRGEPVIACATTGHGELSLTAKDKDGMDWTVAADRLRAEGIAIEELAPGTASVPPRCAVVIVAGPETPLSADEALALQGRALVVAPRSRTASGTTFAPTGLDGVLAAEGLGLPRAIAVDPSLSPRDAPGTLLVIAGYAKHAINVGFANVRPTLWFLPRAIVTTNGATPLITASAESWGETDTATAAAPTKDEADLAGPVALAALGKSRNVLAISSAETMSTAVLAGGVSAADLWLARAVRALAGVPEPTLDVVARAPHQVRLVLTTAQRRVVIALCAGGIPLAWVALGGLVVWWRRRRER